MKKHRLLIVGTIVAIAICVSMRATTAHAQISLVGSATAPFNNVAGGTLTCNSSGANMILVYVSQGVGAATITDSLNNKYVSLLAFAKNDNYNTDGQNMWFCMNPTTSSTHNIYWSDASPQYANVWVSAWGGVGGYAGQALAATGSVGSTLSISSGSLVSNTNGALFLSGAASTNYSGASPVPPVTGTGSGAFTYSASGTNSNGNNGFAWGVQSTAGTVNAAWTLNAGTNNQLSSTLLMFYPLTLSSTSAGYILSGNTLGQVAGTLTLPGSGAVLSPSYSASTGVAAWGIAGTGSTGGVTVTPSSLLTYSSSVANVNLSSLTVSASDVWVTKTYVGSSGTAIGTIAQPLASKYLPSLTIHGIPGVYVEAQAAYYLTGNTFAVPSAPTTGTLTLPPTGAVLSPSYSTFSGFSGLGSWGVSGTISNGGMTVIPSSLLTVSSSVASVNLSALTASTSDVWSGVTFAGSNGVATGILSLASSLVLSSGTIHGSAGTYVSALTTAVSSGYTYGVSGGSVGTYKGAGFNTDPGIGNVLASGTYSILGVTETGTLTLPPTGGVLSPAYSNAGGFSSLAGLAAWGVSGSGSTGTAILPVSGNVLTGVNYGGWGGTLYSSYGSLTIPSAQYVYLGQTYGTLGSSSTGTLTVPTPPFVLTGNTYGIAGTQYVGNYSVTALSPSNVLSPVQWGQSGTQYTGTATTGGGTTVTISAGTLYTTVESAKNNAEVVRKAQIEKTKSDVADAVALEKRQQLFDDTVKAVATLQKAVDTHTASLAQLTTLVEASQKMQNEDHKALMEFFKRNSDKN